MDRKSRLAGQFKEAMELIETGDYHELRAHLMRNPQLVRYRDETKATLLIRLIDYPGFRPNSAYSARILLIAGSHVDVRRDERNGTPLSGAMCTGELDVCRVLLEFGASFRSRLGFKSGDVLDLAEELCRNSDGDSKFVEELRQLVCDYTGIALA